MEQKLEEKVIHDRTAQESAYALKQKEHWSAKRGPHSLPEGEGASQQANLEGPEWEEPNFLDANKDQRQHRITHPTKDYTSMIAFPVKQHNV